MSSDSPRLTGLTICGFKAFEKRQEIPIRPLTLIFGANSSGKSSIIHSLVYAAHVHETGNWDVYRSKRGGNSVDLGGFRQSAYGQAADPLVAVGFEWTHPPASGRKDWFPPFSRCRLAANVGLVSLEWAAVPTPAAKFFHLSLDGQPFADFLAKECVSKDLRQKLLSETASESQRFFTLLDEKAFSHPVLSQFRECFDVISTGTETVMEPEQQRALLEYLRNKIAHIPRFEQRGICPASAPPSAAEIEYEFITDRYDMPIERMRWRKRMDARMSWRLSSPAS